MDSAKQVFHVKLDSSGRLLIPSESRERYHMESSDTLVVVDDGHGLRVRTREQLKADVQAYFADLAPPDVLLSDEIIRDRRAEHERD